METTNITVRRTHVGVLSDGVWTAHAREEWRPVGRYEGKYEVSSLGRLRVTKTGQIKAQHENRRHLRSRFYLRGRHTAWTHQLVAEAFIGPRPEGMEVRHLDGNGLNNVPSNLAYGTHTQNVRDRREHGTNVNYHTGQTECKRGHPFTDENTYRSRGKRACATCTALRARWQKAGEWDWQNKCHISERKQGMVEHTERRVDGDNGVPALGSRGTVGPLAWIEEASAARSNPGSWVLLSERMDGNSAWVLANRINKGVRAAFRPAGHYEACTRGTTVYVRYIGPQ